MVVVGVSGAGVQLVTIMGLDVIVSRYINFAGCRLK